MSQRGTVLFCFPPHSGITLLLIIFFYGQWSRAPLCNLTPFSTSWRMTWFVFCLSVQDSECVCADGNVVSACRRRQNPCSPSACLNNATCVSRGNDYVCRWDACRRLIEATLAVAFFSMIGMSRDYASHWEGRKKMGLFFFFFFLVFHPFNVIRVHILLKSSKTNKYLSGRTKALLLAGDILHFSHCQQIPM